MKRRRFAWLGAAGIDAAADKHVAAAHAVHLRRFLCMRWDDIEEDETD
jgi:hypothetical protein